MRLRLRVRGAIAFALLALLVSVGLATLTFKIARDHLVDQRRSLVVRQAGLNALSLDSAIATPDADISSLLASLPGAGARRAIARVDGAYYSSPIPTSVQLVPRDVVNQTTHGHATEKLVRINGTPTMVVGLPLKNVTGEYYEIDPLTELQRTLSLLAWSFAAAAAFTVVVGAGVGVYASRRVLRPLREFSNAAEQIGTGRFETRLSTTEDPDLAPFAAAFNEMAEALEHRIERDARFASDVSHELRNPLTALSAAVDVLETRADDRTLPAVDVLRSQVTRFRQLVLDLLELSRFDSGRPELVLEALDLRKCVASTVEVVTGRSVELVVANNLPQLLVLDERRVERSVANLLENAERHGGGATRVEITAADGYVRIAVDDDGPGVPEAERAAIFERFHRGPRQDDAGGGSGLGLAIVAEHCHAHHGYARVEPRPGGGGARFVAVFREGDPA